MNAVSADSPLSIPNIRRFIAFRILFNARFYYPVFTILFLDFGLSLEQFAILNSAWAASIVLLEVPSGALADTIGRRNLVVASAVIMIIEMLLLCLAPIGHLPLVFYLFLANRILSGAAEAAASGADEALAYDTLKDLGRERSWGRVLETQMRLQSIAFIIAMSMGALLYDADRLNQLLGFLGLETEISSHTAIRLPLIMTLLLGIGALITSLRLEEPESERDARRKAREAPTGATIRAAFSKTISTGRWILHTPLAFMIILGGFLIDHIARMILTLNSEYYRRIELPEASFGIISAGFGILGVFTPRIGRWLSENRSKSFNYFLLGAATFLGLYGMTWFFPIWGVAPMLFIYFSIGLAGYLVSNYLNAVTPSDARATALSFKGLSYNLAYGGIGLLYSLLIYKLRHGESFSGLDAGELDAALFKRALGYFPAYFVVVFLATLAYAIYQRKAIDTQPIVRSE